MIRWQRAGWRWFWRGQCRPGRPRIPLALRTLIRRMAREHPLWGEQRIASELLVKLGIRISPRTVRRDMPKAQPGLLRGDQRGSAFLKHHARAIVACDFFVALTATFRMLYVCVAIEHASRRLVRVDGTAYPSAQWTVQQLREGVGYEDRYRYWIHKRDRIFANRLDTSIDALGLSVLKSPPRAPQAHAVGKSVIGTLSRERLDWMIPLSERHLRSILQSWGKHYHRGSAHSALGPGVPHPPQDRIAIPKTHSRHRLAAGTLVLVTSILGGWHHAYSLAIKPMSA